jgi:hypothetical protein
MSAACFDDLIGRQFGRIDLRSECVPRLGSLIEHVVEVCSEKQTTANSIWFSMNAWRIVTAMKDIKAFWYWSINQFPCHSMNLELLTVVDDPPVTVLPTDTKPEPTAFSSFYA